MDRSRGLTLGSATNLYSNALRIGSTAGYFLFGSIAEHLGYRAVFAICATFACLALMLIFVPVLIAERPIARRAAVSADVGPMSA
jgi:predicted MFS family arabinose efflux permease